MLRLIISTLLAIFCIVLFKQQQEITMLHDNLQQYQSTMDLLRLEVAKGDARSTLAIKMGLANHTRLITMQRRKMVTVTAYSPRLEETDNTPFHTASNRRVRAGIVAVSRDLFDKGWVFGRKIYIKSLGIFTIDDLMANRKRNQIDVFMFDTDRAERFGRKHLEAHLLAIDDNSCDSQDIATKSRYIDDSAMASSME